MSDLYQEQETCKDCRYYQPGEYKSKGYCDLWWGYVKSDHQCDDYEPKEPDK
jgi:hypothetical protein